VSSVYLVSTAKVVLLGISGPEVTRTIGGLPAFGRAEPRSAAGHVGGLQDEVTAPVTGANVLRPLLASQVSVLGAVLHGWRIS
jgi:hypothetical protein